MSGPLLGLVERIRPREKERAERLLEQLGALGFARLRVTLDPAAGDAWHGWLLPRLARRARLLALLRPASVRRALADFGAYFDEAELEPDVERDPSGLRLAAAAELLRAAGKRAVLALPALEPGILARLGPALDGFDALGLRGFPDAAEDGWTEPLRRARELLEARGSRAELWITETGYSTWRRDEINQARSFLRVLDLPVRRVYWYSATDPDEHGGDERPRHFGLWTRDGEPKLLARLWTLGGREALREAAEAQRPRPKSSRRPVLITGGAGFIGTNVATRLVREGRTVIVYDDLSRPGTEANLRWLKETHGGRIEAVVADVRDADALRPCVRRASGVVHLAAQVAVTTSLERPEHDFDVNVRGTFTLLEQLRARIDPPPLIFTSTNKVYGSLEDVALREDAARYVPEDPLARARGVDESRPLDFHSPYGCSKGAADQYVLDYARSWSLPTTVFRMSCVYGPHQRGNEDQGWVCHFLRAALSGRPLTIYGDGKQVRDLLFVDDLCDAVLRVLRDPQGLAGRPYNLGGGPDKALSLLELLDEIRALHGARPVVRFADWRVGDQRWYVSDTSRFAAASGWSARVAPREGLGRLYRWLLHARRPAARRRTS